MTIDSRDHLFRIDGGSGSRGSEIPRARALLAHHAVEAHGADAPGRHRRQGEDPIAGFWDALHTPHVACFVQDLLREGRIHVNTAVTITGISMLCVASTYNLLDLAIVLLQEEDVDLRMGTSNGATPIFTLRVREGFVEW